MCFVANMTIQKLRLLLQKLYDNKVKPWKMILSYRSTQVIKRSSYDMKLSGC